MQAEHSRQLRSSKVLPFDVAPADLAYWGMAGRCNTYNDMIRTSFTVDAAITSLALGEYHRALRTEPVDIFLTALIHSFGLVFSDRPGVTVYNESHGREPWDSEIDLTRTVGWFTSL